jgi:hypothetical protein
MSGSERQVKATLLTPTDSSGSPLLLRKLAIETHSTARISLL